MLHAPGFKFYLITALVLGSTPALAAQGPDLKFVPGDERGNEKKALATELLVSKSEQQAMSQLQKLIEKYKKTPMEAELWFRMAELHMRRAKTARFFELNRDSETVIKLSAGLASKVSEKQAVQNAIAVYDRIQKEFRKFDDMDLVYFNNAFARQQLGRDREAEALYEKLVDQFPESGLVPDCYLAMGEINYERKNFQGALDQFLKIKKYPTARAYPYGLYKAAWTYYNMQDGQHALKQLEEVVAYGKMIHEQGLDAKLDLRKEALNDMTFFFGDTLPSSRAVSYFVAQAAELPVEPVILRLGRLYNRHSKYNDLDVVYQEFIKKFPKSPALHLMHNELVQNFETTKNREGAIVQLEKMKALCDKTRTVQTTSAIQKADQIASQDDKTCDELIVETSHTLAAKWHSLWLKNKVAAEMAGFSQRAYEVHLKTAKPSDEVAKTRYSYAELLFQQSKYRAAAEQYTIVTDTTQDKKQRHEAAHAALVSLEKATGDKWSDADESTFKRLAEVYRANAPEGPFMLDIDFKIGLIAYEKNRYDEAAPVFRRIGWKYKTSEKGLKAQDLFLDILNLKKDYAGLVSNSKELMAFGAEGARKTHLSKIYREAYFSQIQTYEEKGETLKAIAEYQKFADENRTSDLAPKAWWNATQLLYKSGNYLAGAESSYQYFKRFKKEKNALEALIQAAENFENMAQLNSAAAALEDLALADAKNAQKWLGVAADFYALIGQPAKARQHYRVLAKSSTPATARSAVEKWLAMEKAVRGEGYQDALRLALERNYQPHASQASLAKLEAYMEKKDLKEAFSEAKRLVGQEGGAKYAQAKARLVQAEILDDEFRNQSVKAKVERIATVLAIKTEKLDKTQRAYQSAVSYGDPAVSVSAIRKLASAYDHYAKSLRSIPLPEDLPQADVDAFRAEIDNLALPIEDKAVDTLNEGLEAAKKAKLFNGAVAELQADLNKLNQSASSEVLIPVSEPKLVVPTFGGSGS